MYIYGETHGLCVISNGGGFPALPRQATDTKLLFTDIPCGLSSVRCDDTTKQGKKESKLNYKMKGRRANYEESVYRNERSSNFNFVDDKIQNYAKH